MLSNCIGYKMEKEKIVLAEFHGKEIDVPIQREDSTVQKATAFRIFRLYDHLSTLITQYDPKTDSIDLTRCIFRRGHTLVTVAAHPSTHELGWMAWTIENVSKEGFILGEQRWCSEDESAVLDGLYAGYREKCFLDPSKIKMY